MNQRYENDDDDFENRESNKGVVQTKFNQKKLLPVIPNQWNSSKYQKQRKPKKTKTTQKAKSPESTP